MIFENKTNNSDFEDKKPSRLVKQLLYLTVSRDHIFNSMMLMFMFLPSFHVISCIYGTRTTSSFTKYWIYIFLITGSFVYLKAELFTYTIFIIVLQSFLLGLHHQKTHESLQFKRIAKDGSNLAKFCSYPFLFILSPALILLIKLQKITNPTNELVKAQNMVVSQGQALMKSMPKIILQIYIFIANTHKPISYISILSTVSSALTITLPAIEQFLLHRKLEKTPNNYAKYGIIFVSNNLFRVLSAAIYLANYRIESMIFFFVSTFVLLYPVLSYAYSIEPIDEETQILAHITITNIQKTERDVKIRIRCFYSSLILPLIFHLSILYEDDPLVPYLSFPYVSENETYAENSAKFLNYLKISSCVAIGFGLLSWVVDFLYAILGIGAVFHEDFLKFEDIQFHNIRVKTKQVERWHKILGNTFVKMFSFKLLDILKGIVAFVSFVFLVCLVLWLDETISEIRSYLMWLLIVCLFLMSVQLLIENRKHIIAIFKDNYNYHFNSQEDSKRLE